MTGREGVRELNSANGTGVGVGEGVGEAVSEAMACEGACATDASRAGR